MRKKRHLKHFCNIIVHHCNMGERRKKSFRQSLCHYKTKNELKTNCHEKNYKIDLDAPAHFAYDQM